MIKIFVITLKDAQDRQRHIRAIFSDTKVSFEFVFGIDGRKLSNEEITAVYDGEKSKRLEKELGPGEIGCTLSHRHIYSILIENNIERALIFEDDVKIIPDLFTLMPFLDTIPVNGYIIKLDKFNGKQTDNDNVKRGHFTPWHRIYLNENYFIGQPLHDPSLGWCYYIDIKAAFVMRDIMSRIFFTADKWSYFRKFIKLRMINKALVFDNDSVFISMIGDRSSPKSTKNKNGLRFIFRKMEKFTKLFLLFFH
jgi:glycosyl transferase family 25